jgi:hypothetical protein
MDNDKKHTCPIGGYCEYCERVEGEAAPAPQAPGSHDEAVERNVRYLFRAKLAESRNTELRAALETTCLNHNLGKNWRFPDGCVCAGCSLLRRIDHAAEVTK